MTQDTSVDYRVEVLVPALDEASTQGSLHEIVQRSAIFFDETLPVFVSIETPSCSKTQIESIVSCLDIDVDAWAVSSQDGQNEQRGDVTPTRELLLSQDISKTQYPVVEALQHHDDQHATYRLVWKQQVFIGRPRLRLIDPSIVFLTRARLLSPDRNRNQDDVLPPFASLEPNVLAPLGSIKGQYPYLPASRLEKVVFKPQTESQILNFPSAQSAPIRAYPAVLARLKYTKIPTLTPSPTTIASLDIEAIPFLPVHGTIETVDLSLTNGKAVSLMPDFLPCTIKSKECITYLYQLETLSPPLLQADDLETPSRLSPGNIEILSVSLKVTINLHPTTSTTAKAHINMSWTTNIDFSTSFHSSFGVPSQSTQHMTRPSSLNFAPYPAPNAAAGKPLSQSQGHGKVGSSLTNRTLSTSLQYHSIPMTITSTTTNPRQIVSISFTAPTTPAIVNQEFAWKVLIVNKSSRVARLAIVPLPKITRTSGTSSYVKRHAPKSSNASIALLPDSTNPTEQPAAPAIAKPVLSTSELSMLHHPNNSPAPIETEFVALTPEVRIGPLAPEQCCEAEIRWIAYVVGVFSVDAIRVVDLARERDGEDGHFGNSVRDIRELPEVVIVETASVEDDNDGR